MIIHCLTHSFNILIESFYMPSFGDTEVNETDKREIKTKSAFVCALPGAGKYEMETMRGEVTGFIPQTGLTSNPCQL
jgi:hypothetical protein